MITKIYWCNSNIIVIEKKKSIVIVIIMKYTVCNSNCNRNYNVICVDYMHAALDSVNLSVPLSGPLWHSPFYSSLVM